MLETIKNSTPITHGNESNSRQDGVQSTTQTQAAKPSNSVEAAQVKSETKIESQEQLEQLVKELNHALDPFRTSIRFGFDNSSEDFYVSVIDSKSNDTIRRFPAENAYSLIPKMNELVGILFDTKG